MADSAVDAAVIAKLAGDATLTALLPDGVFMDIAKSSAKQFVIVSQVIEEDEPMFGGGLIALQNFRYLIKAVDFSTSPSNANTAAARIHTLLQGVALTITGYAHSLTRREERVAFTEVDPANNDRRWQHRGGRYLVTVSPN